MSDDGSDVDMSHQDSEFNDHQDYYDGGQSSHSDHS